MKNCRIFGILMLTMAFMPSCQHDQHGKRGVESVNTQIINGETDGEKVKRIRNIFYSLPSPLELTMLFKKEGVEYHAEKLHETSMRKEYILPIKKALNLGVYGADLSYSGLFSRHQAAIEYFAASQILAEELGIGRTFQNHFISRLEQNASNRDTLLEVVSDFFLENDGYLKEHKQQDISTYVLTGGWIEGMYLGTQMAEDNADAKGIREIITNQKNSVHNVILLLQNLSTDKGVEMLLKEMGELEIYYKEVEEVEVIEEAQAVEEDGVLRIDDSAEEIIMSDSTFHKIKQKVAMIRNNIIK